MALRFTMQPRVTLTSWRAIAETAAYVATSAGRRRGSWDRDHYRFSSSSPALALAKGYDLEPRLIRAKRSAQ